MSGFLPQRGPTIGAKIVLNGIAFDGVQYKAPSDVKRTYPQKLTRVSGAPVYQGPLILTLTWAIVEIDTYQALDVLFNTTLNAPGGPLMQVGWHDPAQAGNFVTLTMWLDAPDWHWSELYLRDVTVRLIEALPGS